MVDFLDSDHSDHEDHDEDHHEEEAQVVLHEEQTPVLHQILPITSHRHEEWLDEDPELHVQKFDELEHEFDDDRYHGLDQVEQASLHHDFDIHKHEVEKLPYDERIHPTHSDREYRDF